MKRIKYISLSVVLLLGMGATVFTSCDRSISGDAEFATFSKTGEIFLDNFVGLGANFYFPFVGDGAKPDVFSVDDTEGFESEASIRIDVPNANDPAGGFAGASFVIDGGARNLTDFDALTFYAKASQAATIGSIGFGQKFRAALTDVDFTTQWQKFIIPIPDPSKLVQVSSVFEFAAGGILPAGAEPNQGQEVGYSFWIDELKFEKLGTLAQPRPSVLNGQDLEIETFIGLELALDPLMYSVNTANGTNQTVSATPAYFTFSSTNPAVARVDELGKVSIVSVGTAEISAIIDGVRAQGSLSVDVLGSFDTAPTPPARNAEDVISIFSDAYTNEPNLNVAVFNNNDIQIEVINFGDDAVVNYANLGFVGMGWDGTADIENLGFLHVDIQVNQGFNPADGVIVELIDFGANNADGGGDDTGGGFRIDGSTLVEGEWIGIDIPVNGFTNGTGGGFLGSPNLNKIARVVFVGGGISDILVDNIYFYR